MELELGLKIRRTREDVSSSVDFRFSKDAFGPLVLSRETDSRFIIIIHLKGFKKEGIEIEINKEGNRITIRGRKAVEEMVLIRWMAWRKEVELRAFSKVFLIPDIVDLDKIKARFDDDDATLTITMPKRVKGISGFKLEEEEEEEERVDFGDLSDGENRAEIQNGEEVEEENGGIMEDEERESQVLGGEEKGFRGGLDEEETQTDDGNLEKIQETNEQDKILEFAEEEQKLGDSSYTETEDSSRLRKVPEIEGKGSHEQTRHEEEENYQEVVEQQVSQEGDIESRAFEEIEEEEPDELDRKRKSRAMEKKTSDDEDDGGLSKVQGIDEPERHNEESKIHEMMEGETCGQEKDKNVMMERENKDAKEEGDGKFEEGFTPNIERTQVVGGDDIAETEETESDELVEKKEEEEETSNVKRESEYRNLIKMLQDTEEQHSKGQKRQEKTPEAETYTGNDIPKPVQETEAPEVDMLEQNGNEEKEKKKSVTMDPTEEVDAEKGEGFATNIAETETKPEEFESDKLEADEVDKNQELVEKKEENAKVGTQSEDISFIKPPEIGEEHFQGQTLHDKHEKRKELVEEKTPKAEKNIGNDTPKPGQEKCEGQQQEEYKGKKTDEAGERKVQEIIRQQEFEEPERCKKESKIHDEEKEEKEIAETVTKEQDSYIPKIAEEKTNFSKNGKLKEEEETAEKKTEFGDDDISRKVRDLDAKKEVDEEMGEGFTPKISKVSETKDKVETDEKLIEKKEEAEENTKVRSQSEDSSLIKELQETEEQQFQGQKRHNKKEKNKELVEEKTPEAETNIANEIPKPVQEIEAPEVATLETRVEKDIADTETKEKEPYRPQILGAQEIAEEKVNFSRKVEEKEETAERKTEYNDDDMSRKVRDIEQRDSDVMKGEEEKDGTQELGLEEKVSDGGKRIMAVAETIAENDRSRQVQEIYEQQSHEEDKRGNQFQKLIGGEKSGHGEVEDVENKKQTTEADRRFRDSAREAQETERKYSDVSEKYGKVDTIQELQENRTYQNEQEEKEKDNGDDGEKTQELVEEKIKDCKEEASETKTNDAARNVEGITKQVEEKAKDCKEEESETENNDVERKVQGIKEHELYEPKRDHVSKIQELVAEPEIEGECDDLRKAHGTEEQELHEPNIHKEHDETRVTGTEEPGGQVKEKFVESMTITEKDSSTNVQEIREERPDKPDSHEKQYKIHEVVEDREAEQEEKNIAKAKQQIEEYSSRKVQEIEKQESDGLMRPKVQDKMQETEEKGKTGAMEDIVLRRKNAKDVSSLSKFRDDEEPELSKPYKRREEDKMQELVEMETSDYREKVKKQDGSDILRGQGDGRPELDEIERHSEQINIPKLVGEEKLEKMAELGRKMDDDSSGNEERKSERKDFAEDEATDHTSGEDHTEDKEERQKEKVIAKAELKTEEDSTKKFQEIEKQRSMVQDKTQETEEKDKTIAMEENEMVERRKKTNEESLRTIRDGKEPELNKPYKRRDEDKIQELVETERSDCGEQVKKQDGDDMLRSQEAVKLDLGELDRHCKEKKNDKTVEDDQKGEGKTENISEPGGKMEGDRAGKFHEFQKQKSYEDLREEESEEVEDLVKEKATDPKDKHTGGKGEHEEERYEKVVLPWKEVENEMNKKVGKTKEPESDKVEGSLREGASDREKLVDEFMTEIQETENEESHESEIHEKLEIVQDFVEDETGDQEDETAEEAAAVVENKGKDCLRKLQTIEEHKEQNIIPQKSDPEAKKEDEERDAEKETKEPETHVQELEGKTEKCKDDDGEKGKTVEREKYDGIVREIRETKVQESSEKKDQEPEEKRKESSNLSKRRPVEQDKIQQLKEVEKREDEEKAEVETKANDGKSKKFKMLDLDESEENEELHETRKANAPKNEKTAEEEMQDKVERRIKDQEIQEPYELVEDRERDKTPEPIVEGTRYHREGEKGMSTDGDTEEMEGISEDFSSRKVEKIKAQESDGLEKQRKLSEIQEKQSVEEKIQEHREEETHEGVLTTKSMEDSIQSQVFEEKGSDQPERDAEQELMAEEEGKEEYNQREGEQKSKIILQVESKANDDSSEKNETERLRGQKKKEDHQELMETETSDQRNEEMEKKIVETKDEYDSSSKIQEHKEEKSNKQDGSLAKEETRNDKEENRAGGETKIRDDGFEEKEEELAIVVRHREQDKKQSFVEKDTSDKAKENKNQETESRDDNSRKSQEHVKQEFHEQKRNHEEPDKTNLRQNYCRNEDDGKKGKDIAEADVPEKSKGTEKRESTETVGRDENKDNIRESKEEKMSNQEGENKKRMIKEVLEEAEDHESKGPEGLRKEDKSRELVQQRSADNLKDDEPAKTETKSKDNESRKIRQIKEKETGEEERRKEQGRIKELVEDRTHHCKGKQNRENESEDGYKKEIDKEEPTEPGRDEKRDEFQEAVDRDTSEDDEEELEVEYEESEEEWEAEIIQEMGSDEDENDKIRQIKRIRLGFRLVGGSALFMSLIVIVIRFVRSKRNIRCYKF